MGDGGGSSSTSSSGSSSSSSTTGASGSVGISISPGGTITTPSGQAITYGDVGGGTASSPQGSVGISIQPGGMITTPNEQIIYNQTGFVVVPTQPSSPFQYSPSSSEIRNAPQTQQPSFLIDAASKEQILNQAKAADIAYLNAAAGLGLQNAAEAQAKGINTSALFAGKSSWTTRATNAMNVIEQNKNSQEVALAQSELQDLGISLIAVPQAATETTYTKSFKFPSSGTPALTSPEDLTPKLETKTELAKSVSPQEAVRLAEAAHARAIQEAENKSNVFYFTKEAAVSYPLVVEKYGRTIIGEKPTEGNYVIPKTDIEKELLIQSGAKKVIGVTETTNEKGEQVIAKNILTTGFSENIPETFQSRQDIYGKRFIEAVEAMPGYKPIEQAGVDIGNTLKYQGLELENTIGDIQEKIRLQKGQSNIPLSDYALEVEAATLQLPKFQTRLVSNLAAGFVESPKFYKETAAGIVGFDVAFSESEVKGGTAFLTGDAKTFQKETGIAVSGIQSQITPQNVLLGALVLASLTQPEISGASKSTVPYASTIADLGSTALKAVPIAFTVSQPEATGKIIGVPVTLATAQGGLVYARESLGTERGSFNLDVAINKIQGKTEPVSITSTKPISLTTFDEGRAASGQAELQIQQKQLFGTTTGQFKGNVYVDVEGGRSLLVGDVTSGRTSVPFIGTSRGFGASTVKPLAVSSGELVNPYSNLLPSRTSFVKSVKAIGIGETGSAEVSTYETNIFGAQNQQSIYAGSMGSREFIGTGISSPTSIVNIQPDQMYLSKVRGIGSYRTNTGQVGRVISNVDVDISGVKQNALPAKMQIEIAQPQKVLDVGGGLDRLFGSVKGSPVATQLQTVQIEPTTPTQKITLEERGTGTASISLEDAIAKYGGRGSAGRSGLIELTEEYTIPKTQQINLPLSGLAPSIETTQPTFSIPKLSVVESAIPLAKQTQSYKTIQTQTLPSRLRISEVLKAEEISIPRSLQSTKELGIAKFKPTEIQITQPVQTIIQPPIQQIRTGEITTQIPTMKPPGIIETTNLPKLSPPPINVGGAPPFLPSGLGFGGTGATRSLRFGRARGKLKDALSAYTRSTKKFEKGVKKGRINL